MLYATDSRRCGARPLWEEGGQGCACHLGTRTDLGDKSGRNLNTNKGGVMSESIGFNPGECKRFGRMPRETEVQPTLRASDGKVGDNSPTVCVGFKAGQGADGGIGDEREVSPTVNSQMSALEPTVAMSYDGYNQSGKEKCCHTLGTCNSESPNNDKVVKIATKQAVGRAMTMQEPRDIADIISLMRYIVRRLTPIECSRLMGLPDKWTIPSNLVITDELVEEFREIHDNFNRIMAEYEGGKPPKPKTAAQVRKWLEKISNPDTCPDAPQYKGDGNGMATNQPRWIILRMFAKEGINPFTGENINEK